MSYGSHDSSVYLFWAQSGLYRELRTWLDGSNNLDIVHLIIVRQGVTTFCLRHQGVSCVGVEEHSRELLFFKWAHAHWFVLSQTFASYRRTVINRPTSSKTNFDTWCIKPSGSVLERQLIKTLSSARSYRRGYRLYYSNGYQISAVTGTLQQTYLHRITSGCCENYFQDHQSRKLHEFI